MRKRLKIVLIAILSLVFLFVGAFLIYASDYYRADDVATAVIQNDSTILIQDNTIILSPTIPSDTALIFYPGAKVEYLAYLPILEKLKQSCDITCILVKMPFNMAIFDANAYASKNQNLIKGLILMGAYVYGSFPVENALTIYGTFNESVAEKIDYTENIVVLKGGNHAQFGNYGKQKGDPDATISREEQQNLTVEAIKEFLTKTADL